MNEFNIIKKYFKPLSNNFSGALNLEDDAAVVSPVSGYDFVITKDSITAGTHFFSDDLPENIAKKLLRVNLSDLAAKGAQPYAYLLSVNLPDYVDEAWLGSFCASFAADIKEFGGSLIGGDTTKGRVLTLSLTAIGLVKSGKMIRRSGAKEGDIIFVSGTIGDAFLGLDIRKLSGDNKSLDNHLLARYLVPQPRVKLGLSLSDIANASIDISDGLVADLRHICEFSGVGAEIYLEKIPVSKPALEVLNEGKYNKTHLITGGDDYEILFTAPVSMRENIKKISLESGVSISEIGVISGGGLVVLDEGKVIDKLPDGYMHF